MQIVKFTRGPGVLVFLVSACITVSGCAGSPSLTPAQHLNAGVAAQGKGDLNKARKEYLAVLSGDANNKAGLNKIAWFDLGVVDQQLGNTQGALTEYQQALAIDPKYTNALYNLAVLQTATAPDTAIALYRDLIAISPRDPNAIYNLGLLLYRTGQTSAGRTLILQAIKIAPSLASKVPPGINLRPKGSTDATPSPTPSATQSP